jgi:hypothetical protein
MWYTPSDESLDNNPSTYISLLGSLSIFLIFGKR